MVKKIDFKQPFPVGDAFDYHDLLRDGSGDRLCPRKVSLAIKKLVLTINELIDDFNKLKKGS